MAVNVVHRTVVLDRGLVVKVSAVLLMIVSAAEVSVALHIAVVGKDQVDKVSAALHMTVLAAEVSVARLMIVLVEEASAAHPIIARGDSQYEFIFT